MAENIYNDLAARCGGKVKIGVVGYDGIAKGAFTERLSAAFPPDVAASSEILTDGEEAPLYFLIATLYGGEGEKSGISSEDEAAAKNLKGGEKPFIIVLNCADGGSATAKAETENLIKEFEVPVLAMNCGEAENADISSAVKAGLFRLPLTAIDVKIPDWTRMLPAESSAITELISAVKAASENVVCMQDVSRLENTFSGCRYWREEVGITLSPATGRAEVEAFIKEGVLFDMLSETCGEDISDEAELMKYVAEASSAKKNYDKLKDAFECARQTGYGIVRPSDEDMTLEKPVVVKQGGNVGIKLKGAAPSYHVVRVDVDGEVSPIMGNAATSGEMVEGIMQGFESDPAATWNTDLFGKSLKSMVKEGLDGKVNSMQDDARGKMRKAITRIVNEGKGGVICILL